MNHYKKVVITGGAGFVGSHLCEELLKFKGVEIYSIDDYSSGSKANHINGVKYINGKSCDIDSLIEFEPSHVFHLGEYSRVEASFKDIDKVFDSNMSSIYNILKFIKKTGAKLVYSGSSTKFADDGKNVESNPYAWTKSTNTELVKTYSKWFDINYAITYFYNVFGGREIADGNYATVVGIFKKKYLNDELLEVVLPGTQKRNFTHIDDIISALVLIGINGQGDGYGIGSTEVLSIEELAQLFNTRLVYLPERKGNRMLGKLKTKKTIELGWQPKKSIKKHIKEFINQNL